MNPFEFVLAIIFLTGIFALVRQRMGVRHIWERPANEDNQETIGLRDEVRELKDRIKVLERITVEKENSLAKEIECSATASCVVPAEWLACPHSRTFWKNINWSMRKTATGC